MRKIIAAVVAAVVVLAGCGHAPGAGRPAHIAITPYGGAPSPQPTLQISARMGWEVQYTVLCKSLTDENCGPDAAGPPRFVPGLSDPYPNGASNVVSDNQVCKVRVTNLNGTMVYVSSVELGFYDAQGNQVATDNTGLGITGLAAGQSISAIYDTLPSGTVTCSALNWLP